MKQILKSVLLIGAFATLLFAPSCQTTCDTGYEGKRCDVPWRDKFKGIWNATDDSVGVMLTYTDTVTDGNDVTDVYLSKNFSNKKFGHAIKATINNTIINIVSARPDITKNIWVEGTGTLNSSKNTINLTYKITNKDSPVAITTLTGVWIKQ